MAGADVDDQLPRCDAGGANELVGEPATAEEVLSEAREEMRSAGRSSETADWRRALDSGILDLIRNGRVPEAKELLRACL